MKPDLSDIRDRMKSAVADYNTVAYEINATINGQPPPLDFGYKPYPDEDHQLVYISRLEATPKDWGRRVSHYFYDMRSCLDQLVHQLYIASNKRKPPLDIESVLAFPICDNKAAWTNASRQDGKKPSRLQGLDPRFIKIIHKHQPFRKYRVRHALARLQAFNDLDKHRRPNVVLFAPGDLEIGYVAGPSCRVLAFEPYPLGRVLKVGTKLALVTVTATAIPKQMCVNVVLRGPLKPALERGVILDDLVEKVVTQVNWIVTECEGAL